MTGFRVSPSGWYGLEGVAGDLYCFGKVMSGGLPAAAFGGSAEIMGHLAPAGPVYQAGTLAGNPVAVAAGLTTLRHATDDVYAALDAGARPAARPAARRAVRCRGRAHDPARRLARLDPCSSPSRAGTTTDMKAAETWRFPPFFHALLDRGVYYPPSAFEAWFVSAALDDDAFGVIADALPAAAAAAAAATRPEQA